MMTEEEFQTLQMDIIRLLIQNGGVMLKDMLHNKILEKEDYHIIALAAAMIELIDEERIYKTYIEDIGDIYVEKVYHNKYWDHAFLGLKVDKSLFELVTDLQQEYGLEI